jgi:amino acid transporter
VSDQKPTEFVAPQQTLSWFDATSIIVGIIIGAGIYQATPQIAHSIGAAKWLMFLWFLGGVFSLCGALCYAELASAFPRAGGDYVYLSRAYGPWAGFLFGWLQTIVVRPGDIAGMGFIFATYGNALAGTSSAHQQVLVAAVAVGVLTLVNVIGVRLGTRVQNGLTMFKVFGLLGVVAVAFLAPAHSEPGALSNQPSFASEVSEIPHHDSSSEASGRLPITVAFILILFSYGGWNEMAYVAAEVKDPRRNLVRSLISGTVVVTTLYLLVNGAFLHALGIERMSRSSAVATDAISTAYPEYGPWLVGLLICVSSLGALNGLIFAGARISYAMGTEQRWLRMLGKWDPRTGTPVNALLLQGGIAIVLIVLLGSFEYAVIYTAAAVYTFYLASAFAVAVLRWREPDLDRPYRVTAFPIPLIFFVMVCGYLIYSAAIFAPRTTMLIACLTLVGLVLARVGR